MNRFGKSPPLLRVASRIREHVLQRQNHNTNSLQYQLSNINYRLEQLAAIKKRLTLCEERGFHLARVRVVEQLQYALRDLPHEITQIASRIPQEREVLSLGEVVKEFEQLEDEFGEWRFDSEESCLVVTTDSITLEDITLGSFEIRLCLPRLGRGNSSPPYTVVALEPHCPESNESVTHPHVQDNHLCEGDAAAAIHGALAEGRICDFFVLVRSVLETYNKDSPYVALENWYGHPCYDCGCVVDEDERYYCESCDHDFCSDCISCCTMCDRSLCTGCLEECGFCEDRICSHCAKHCAECGKTSCESCLEEGLCPDCREPQEEEEDSHDDDISPVPATSVATSAAIVCAHESDVGNPTGGGQVQPSVRVRRRNRHRPAQAA